MLTKDSCRSCVPTAVLCMHGLMALARTLRCVSGDETHAHNCSLWMFLIHDGATASDAVLLQCVFLAILYMRCTGSAVAESEHDTAV